jgi:DNA-binding transcriptional ArsR family regulator
MLEKLFTSGIRADIMSLLFNNPDEKFYVREIARLINKNPSGVKRELDKLKKMDLVISEKEGKSILKASDAKTAFIYGPYINNTGLPSLDLFIVSDSNHVNKIVTEVEKRFGRKIRYTVMNCSE